MSNKASSQHVSNRAKEKEEENNANPSAVAESYREISSNHRAVNKVDCIFMNSQNKNGSYNVSTF